MSERSRDGAGGANWGLYKRRRGPETSTRLPRMTGVLHGDSAKKGGARGSREAIYHCQEGNHETYAAPPAGERRS